MIRSDLPFQNGIGVFVADDAKRSILLELFDNGAGHEHLNARMQRAVFKSGDGDRVNVAQIIRLGRPDGVAHASGQTEYGECRAEKILHGVGDALLSGVADGAGVGETAGAVVVTGLSEAGGGSETSSGGGNGATSEEKSASQGRLVAVRRQCAIVGFFFGCICYGKNLLHLCIADFAPQFVDAFFRLVSLSGAGLLTNYIIIIE